MFVFTTCDSGTTEQQAHKTPWDDVSVGTIIPDGWSLERIEDGLRVLERIRRQVDSASAALVAAMPDCRDAVVGLVRVTGVSASEARRRRLIAAVVRESPVAARLLAAGLLSGEHVAALAPIRDHVEDLNVLAMWSVGKLPEDVRHEVEQVRLSHVGGTDAAARHQALRRLVISTGPEGIVAISGLLPPREGALLESLLRSVMDADWRSEHPERAGTLGGHGGDSRDQRRLDALLQLLGIVAPPAPGVPIADAGTPVTPSAQPAPPTDDPVAVDGFVDHCTDVADAGGGRMRPVRGASAKPAIVIVFDVDRYEAEILGRGPIPVTPDLFDTARADLYYFFKNTRGEILKFGRAKRDPTAAQRLAVEVRDRHCIYPSCRVPASRCQVHHLNEWLIDQGFTDVEVLGLFCDAHHRHLHTRQLVATRQPDGTVVIRIRASGEVIATGTNPPSLPGSPRILNSARVRFQD